MIQDLLTKPELIELLPYLTAPELAELDLLIQSQAQIPEFKFRGAALALQSMTAREIVISGPSETGKTIGALKFVDTLCRLHPKLSGAIVRKVRADMNSTILKVFRRAFVLPGSGIQISGGESVEFFQYENGSRLWVGGMDRPGKVLSGELDLAYVNQAEELSLDDWEVLSTRTTGRAGVLVPGILIGDANPGAPHHWILGREAENKLIKLESRHEDNPRLYTDDGLLTKEGISTMHTLDNLTGVRKERLRYGRWVQAEGVVYEEFDPALHVIDVMPTGWQQWHKIRSIDFGFTNPFSCSWWAIDPDGRMILYRQIYATQKTVKQHAKQINQLTYGIPADEWDTWQQVDGGLKLELIIRALQRKDLPALIKCLGCTKAEAEARIQKVEVIDSTTADHDAEDRATLAENGIFTVAAKKDISTGIERVKERLKLAGNGKPRILFLRTALVERDEALALKHKPLCTTDELLVYSYPKAADGKLLKEAPIDLDNHGCDEMRYAVAHLDAGITGKLFY